LTGADAGNYSFAGFTSATKNYAVGQLALTGAAISSSGNVYGGTVTSGAATFTNTIAGDVVSTATAIVNPVYSSSGSLNAGSYRQSASTTLIGIDAPNYNYSGTISNSGINYIVTPAPISLVGSQVYNGTATISGSNLKVVVSSGDVFTVSGVANLTTKNIQTNQPLADVAGLVITSAPGILLSNYQAVSAANSSITVTPLSVTLTAPVINKTYDGGFTYNMTTANLAAMSSQLAGGDTVSTASVAFAGSGSIAASVGINKLVNLLAATINDGNNGANYNVSLGSSHTSSISPASLTITAANSAKFINQSSDPMGYNGLLFNGFVNGESISVLTGAITFTRSGSGSNTPGIYTLSPSGYGASGSTNGNYQINYQNGSFTIVPAQTLLVKVDATISAYSATPAYTMTAQYLAADNLTIVNVTPVISGRNVSINDGNGDTASFAIAPTGNLLSGSGNVVVGGYNIVNTTSALAGPNFKSMTLIGTLAVTPLTLGTNQLGISGISKVYDGNNSIAGNVLSVSPTLSRVVAGDDVTVLGTGSYDDQNVGTNKSTVLNVALGSRDAANYILSSNQLTSNTGTITQLPSVAYVGVNGGNWSNASNWAGGAIPTLSNVANAVIPIGSTVIFDTPNLSLLMPTSTINNNGVLSFTNTSPTMFANNISGVGMLNLAGVGSLTLTGANTYSGGTNINTSTLIIGSNSALGTGIVNSTGGVFSVVNGIVLPSLTVNGAVTLASSVTSIGTQVYNGPVTINNASNLTTLTTTNADITFGRTLIAGMSNQSLTLSAGAGQVTFGDQVGVPVQTYNTTSGLYTATPFHSYLAMSANNLTNLVVNAGSILLKGDITTFGTQSYSGNMQVGDNGRDGPTRILLSEDPSIVLNGKIDDVTTGQHNLLIRAVTIDGSQVPSITLNSEVGSIRQLESLTMTTGMQNTSSIPIYSDTTIDPTKFVGSIAITNNVSTTGNQTYTSNTITLGTQINLNPQTFISQGGVISFNVGTLANNGSIASLNTLPVQFKLYGGSMYGLDHTGVNYDYLVDKIITSNLTPTFDAGTLREQFNKNRLQEFFASLERDFEEVQLGIPEIVCIETETHKCSGI
jgi:autotransporter-associated beta strand protein